MTLKQALFFTLVLGSQAYAQTTEIEIENTKKIQNLKFDLGISAVSNLEGAGDTSGKATGRGFNMAFGKLYDLNESLTAATSLSGQYSSLDLETGQVDYRTYDIGVVQEIRVRIPMNNILLQPFAEVGASRGNLTTNAMLIQSKGSGRGIDIIGAEVDQGYTRLTAGTGLRLQYHGISPFIKYNYSRLLLDSDADVELTLNGQEATAATVSFQSTNIDLNAQEVTIGLGFDF